MKFLAALSLPVLAAAVPLTFEATTPPPGNITIASVSTSGNGCPSGTVVTEISADRTVITFGFDGFQTYIGPTVAVDQRTKNCQIHMNLNYPAGFSFAVVESVYHGYAQLDPGVTGTFLSTYFFSQAASNTTTTRTTLVGDSKWQLGQVYTKTDTVPTTAIIYAPCGSNGILNINNRIALTSTVATAVGQISNDDATVAFTQQVNIAWTSCK